MRAVLVALCIGVILSGCDASSPRTRAGRRGAISQQPKKYGENARGQTIPADEQAALAKIEEFLATKPHGRSVHLAMFDEIEAGHVETVKRLLDGGADPNCRVADRVPLMVAVSSNNAGAVRALLEKGADPDTKVFRLNNGATVVADTEDEALGLLYLAAEQGNAEIVRLLLEAGADFPDPSWGIDCCPLNAAVGKAPPAVVQHLLAKQDQEVTRGEQRDDNFLPVVQLLLAARPKDYPLDPMLIHNAVEQGLPKILKALLDAGADVTHRRLAGILITAADTGNAETTRILLNAGLDVSNAPGGYTPLHAAARAGHAEVARILIAAGADPNAKSVIDGKTPLDLAKSWKHAEVIELLEQYSSDGGKSP